MVAEDFILAKRKSWERLTDLIKGAQSNIVALNAADLQELGRLYRQTTSDLAQARRDYPGHQLTVYLNDLVAQGHSAIYREQISSSTAKIKHYFAVLLPQTFRQTLPFTLIAFLVFLIPALVGAVIAAGNPDAGVALQPELQPTIENMRIGHEWWQDINDGNSGSAAFILTNNISVSFKAFIGGLSLGLFTLYILYYNGLMLGIV
ncbi:MAG TPA: stage II sporulation protein M, partial [Herpetosiphonaceae bacterium]